MSSSIMPYQMGSNACATASSVSTIILCLSGKGGQGASLLSLHLASILSSFRRTLLIDLDPCSTHRYFLEEPECPGLANLVMVQGGIAPLKPCDFTRRHPCGFDILAGPRCAEEWVFLYGSDLRSPLGYISHAYDVVVVDLSSNRVSGFLQLTSVSSINLLVLRADLLSARSAVQLIEEMKDFGSGSMADTALVANCSPPHPILHPEHLSNALQLPLLASLPYDQAAGEDFASLSPAHQSGSAFRASVLRLAMSMGLIDSRQVAGDAGKPVRCLRSLLRFDCHNRYKPRSSSRFHPDGGIPCIT